MSLLREQRVGYDSLLGCGASHAGGRVAGSVVENSLWTIYLAVVIAVLQHI